jgi:hypothetical protein
VPGNVHGTSAEARRDAWWFRLRARVSARIEARRRQRAYLLSRPPSIQQALWRLHDERELRRRRSAYVSRRSLDPGGRSDVARASSHPSPGTRSSARDAATLVVAVAACSAYVLGTLAFVLDGDPTPPISGGDRQRAAAPPPSAAEPTAGGPSDDGGAAPSARGFYRSELFQFWHPSGWTVSDLGRMSVLRSPDADVTVSFAPAPGGSLENIAEGTLAGLEARYGDIRLLPADLTFAGKRSLAIGGSASAEGGSSSRFVVIAVSRPAGSATITMTFAPHATPPAHAGALQRILDSFRMRV